MQCGALWTGAAVLTIFFCPRPLSVQAMLAHAGKEGVVVHLADGYPLQLHHVWRPDATHPAPPSTVSQRPVSPTPRH